MAKVKCQLCGKEIIGGAKVLHFDLDESTTIHVFCSEICKNKWINKNNK
ncbi:MAG: hypothetical protein ACFFA7_12520 [Promethearchaeota archaeon]